MNRWPYALTVSAFVALTGAQARTSQPTAVFNFGFDDTSLEAPTAEEKQRLGALDAQLRDILAKSGCCKIVSLDAVTKQPLANDTWKCNGCDVDLARKAGAKISVTGWVQKVSNLILNINIVARDVSTGRAISVGSVDIRGNTDESWSRGLSYLLTDRLHPAQWR